MPRPLAGDAAGPDRAAQPVPEHPVQVVGRELRALEPPVLGAPVQYLHQLQRFAGDAARGVGRDQALAVADTGHREAGVGIGLQRADQRRQVVGVPGVVGRQVGQVRRRGAVDPVVEGGAEAAVAREHLEPDARVLERVAEGAGRVTG
jgi:hypothetical protein